MTLRISPLFQGGNSNWSVVASLDSWAAERCASASEERTADERRCTRMAPGAKVAPRSRGAWNESPALRVQCERSSFPENRAFCVSRRATETVSEQSLSASAKSHSASGRSLPSAASPESHISAVIPSTNGAQAVPEDLQSISVTTLSGEGFSQVRE